ncbi:hypothetical protein DVH24_042655 [Malus domestica]|uniref:Uncharacterized protein n=1 Tax=Malus domestica TaxID=3750 RepID=A0A498HW86_MALDO|nr:hypothetical protein DVH24_042655 [Malus domestica]
MKVWLCRFLALHSNLSNEARVPCTLSNKGSQTAMESAKKVLKASIERQVGRPRKHNLNRDATYARLQPVSLKHDQCRNLLNVPFLHARNTNSQKLFNKEDNSVALQPPAGKLRA